MKGLYLTAKLFDRQLAELREAGFASADLDAANSGGASEKKDSIIITFDDGFQSVFNHGLHPLREHAFRAIQFIVADRIGQRNEWDMAVGEVPEPLMTPEQIREWLAAGHQIGSHSLSHPFLSRLPVDEAREEITASKKKLEDLFSIQIRHFCYPYGDWTPRLCDLVEGAGYRTACTTEFGVNGPKGSPFSLKRISARYPSRNWKALRKWCAERFKRRK